VDSLIDIGTNKNLICWRSKKKVLLAKVTFDRFEKKKTLEGMKKKGNLRKTKDTQHSRAVGKNLPIQKENCMEVHLPCALKRKKERGN